MGFKTFRKTDNFISQNGTVFLNSELLESLLDSEEYNLLHFLVERAYHTLHDFPVRGVVKHLLLNSDVKGPYVYQPKVEKPENQYLPPGNKVVRKLILVEETPASFEKVQLLSFGLRSDSDIMKFGDRRVDQNLITELSVTSRYWLQEHSDEYHTPEDDLTGSTINAIINNCMVSIHSDKRTYPYPILHGRVFGREKDNPQDVMAKFNLARLSSAFSSYKAEAAFEQTTQNGLAYNVPSFDVNKDFKEQINVDNIIL